MDNATTPSDPYDVGDRAFEWWRGVREDRAAMAALRRCRRPVDALLVPPTLSLIRRLPRHNADRVAALAAVLGHVRDNDDRSIARAVGRPAFDKTADAHPSEGPLRRILSEGRLRRILQVEDTEELQRAMTRLMRFVGHKASVRDLARSMVFWGDRTKRRWVFDYYAVSIANPDARPGAGRNGPFSNPSASA